VTCLLSTPDSVFLPAFSLTTAVEYDKVEDTVLVDQ
jgi:hypothetical protein